MNPDIMSMAEALMQIAPNRAHHAMRPRDLGAQINIVKSPWSGCPYCHAAKSTMTVHEFGVRWPCGCARALDPIHRTPEERARCRKCCPVEETNVIPIRRSA